MSRAGFPRGGVRIGAAALLLGAAALFFRSSGPEPARPSMAPAAASERRASPPAGRPQDPSRARRPQPPRGDVLLPPAVEAAGSDAKRPARPRPPEEECREVLVFLQPGTPAEAWGRGLGMTLQRTLRSDPDAHVFAAPDGAAARRALSLAREDGRARSVDFNRRTRRVHCDFVHNDPYFNNDNNPAGFPGQWHLGNGASTTHANVLAAWANNYVGTGVVIGIVDDCLETAHPDLQPNYLPGDSWNFGQNNNNPNPGNAALNGTNDEDRHGISVAGVAAARGGNSIGGTGAAPFASLAGLRVDFPNQTTQMFVDATLFHSSGGTTTIKVKNHSYGYSDPFIETLAERNALSTSATAGTIHCLAAGNERGFYGQDANKQDLQSSPNAISVAAVAADGTFASYSSFGACVFVAAPSNGASGFGITTTDRTGARGYCPTEDYDPPPLTDPFPDPDYTSRFGGTSSATPLVAGVLALAKEAQPALNTRFAKHLLVRTSRIIDPDDDTTAGGGDGSTGSAWRVNGAGWAFNQNYGFGLIDADALTQAAPLYAGVTTLQTESTGTIGVSTAIPDNAQSGISHTFPLVSTVPLEEVLVTIDINHPRRGDLEAYLTSPAGTLSRLFTKSSNDTDPDISWTFSTNAFWGETPAGTWSLLVRDMRNGITGTWTSFSVTARMGMLTPTVRNVTSTTPDGAYGAGTVIPIQVRFSANVIVTGTPQLTLETGTVDAVAPYTSGSGTDTLTFTYTVAASDLSPDLEAASPTSLALNGGTIRDAGAHDAVLTLPAAGYQRSLSANKAIAIDSTPPLAGTVHDGYTGADIDVQLSRTSLAATWSGFSDPESSIAGYEWAIGTTPGAQDVQAFASVALATAASTAAVNLSLFLATGTPYYVTVRATNGVGLTTTATSDGVTVTGTDPGPPAVPTGFTAIAGNQMVLLLWDADPDAPTHQLWWKPTALPSWTNATLVGGLKGTALDLTGLVNGIGYDFMLKAVDAAGNESGGVFDSATPGINISVGGTPYVDLQTAIYAAAAGQTVTLGPGIFSGALTLKAGVSLTGASARHTFILGTPGVAAITVLGTYLTDPTSTIGSLSITNGSVGVLGGTADVLLDHVILHHLSSHGASSAPAGRLRAVNCTIASNGGDGIFAQGTASARNVIAGKNVGTGLNLPAGSSATYNDTFGNAAGLSPGLTVLGNQGGTAKFVDDTVGNYLELPASPSIDAGDPADAFLLEPAPNGTRINQGAFGNTPWATVRVAVASSGGGGGGCGATGLEPLLLIALLLGLRRR